MKKQKQISVIRICLFLTSFWEINELFWNIHLESINPSTNNVLRHKAYQPTSSINSRRKKIKNNNNNNNRISPKVNAANIRQRQWHLPPEPKWRRRRRCWPCHGYNAAPHWPRPSSAAPPGSRWQMQSSPPGRHTNSIKIPLAVLSVKFSAAQYGTSKC